MISWNGRPCTGYDRLVPQRTSVINQIRAFLLERGISFHTGRANLRRHMAYLLEGTNQKLTARLRRLLHLLWQEWQHLEIQIESLTEEIEMANQDEACRRAASDSRSRVPW
jgi:transposase